MSCVHGLAVAFAFCSSGLIGKKGLPAVSDLQQGFFATTNCLQPHVYRHEVAFYINL